MKSLYLNAKTNMQKLVALSDIDDLTTTLKYSEAQNNKSGKGRSVLVHWRKSPTDRDPIRLLIQTPKMSAPFGFNLFHPEDGGPDKYSVTLSFKGAEENDRIKQFLEKMKQVDMANLDEAVGKQQQWWPGSEVKDRAIIEDRYTPVVKPDKNGKYQPTMRLKLPFKNGAPDFKVFNAQGTEVPLSYVEGSCNITCLIEIGTIWLADKKFGHNIKIIQMKVFKQESFNTLQIHDHPDDVEMEDAPPPAATDNQMGISAPFE